MKNFPVENSCAVYGENECVYQCVLDDFKNAEFIGIMTYNISPRANSVLLNKLKSACKRGANAVLVTNIPNRFPQYCGAQYAVAAKKKIELYKRQLNPSDFGMRLSPYFNFHNHSKIIMTENIVYWGSCNFSDESRNNIECGTISTDQELIKYLKDVLFPHVQRNSISYYKYNYAAAIAKLEDLIAACGDAEESLFEAAFEPYAEYETKFQEEWVYRKYDSGITSPFLQNFIDFFAQFEDALKVIDDIIDEYAESDPLPGAVEKLQNLYEEYGRTYDNFYENLYSLFDDLKQMAQYDVSVEACSIIENEYGMEAYDEELDTYAEKAMNEASGRYEELIREAEQTVRDSLSSLETMIQYFKQLEDNLYGLLEINPQVDNTGLPD